MQIKERRPEWLRIKLQVNESFMKVRNIISEYKLHTVCEEARCPNMSECWSRGTATFMILGDICTRSCGFCAVKTGKPIGLDTDEPQRVAQAVKLMGIKHAVITSVNRDDLKDGGAGIFAETIKKIRELVPECRVEVLIPDFKGDEKALDIVIEAKPDILNHNVETVPRLYKIVRPQAKYERSLKVLDYCKKHGLVTKTGLILGIGEKTEEVVDVMKDLRSIDVDILTLGQYLQPTKIHLPIDRFVPPEEFEMLKKIGLEMGFRYVESGPLVRSSYHAESHIVW
ncbi:lipoic acid synthetase [Candidatus Thermokryptus mobilis]|uniref:Lipoyl synthase n=1 Tax=Candidatus Thermokryptus mobilis TaxID=1643428 RepID=A0A0S4NC02_9BACT|nr:lipoyl synthase [Candidatus Thermokryptus mobilis]CUU08770.1 lipoic acid synthetase [Candidatus Thermokryptus mobilis]